MLEIKNLKKTQKSSPKEKNIEKRNLEPKALGNYETNIKDMGEYYVDEGSATSIYSKSHETTIVKIETETGIVGWGEAQSPVSPNTTATPVNILTVTLTSTQAHVHADSQTLYINNTSRQGFPCEVGL